MLEEEEEEPEMVVEISLSYVEVKTNKDRKQEARLTNRVPKNSLYFRTNYYIDNVEKTRVCGSCHLARSPSGATQVSWIMCWS